MLSGLPGGSGDRGRGGSWLQMALLGACAVAMVAGLLKGLFYVMDVIVTTRPN